MDIPQAPDIELAVLASLYLHPAEAFPVFNQHGRREFFFAHQLAFQAIEEFFLTHGFIDPTGFVQFAQDSGVLDKIGGGTFFANLFSHDSPLGVLSYHIDILRDHFVKRQLFKLAFDLPQQIKNGADLPTILAQREAELAALRLCGSPNGRLPPMCDLAAKLGPNLPPPPPELIQGILHKGSKIIVGGTSKARKTYSLIDLAVSIVTASTWWGFDCAQGKVAYINFEIPEAFFCSRVEDIAHAKNLSIPPNMLYAWNLRGHSEGIENLMDDILYTLKDKDLALVIFDPIYKGLGQRDENKAGDIASLMNQLERVAVTTGAAIAFGAHYSKGNQALKESIDRIGGSGVFARDPDSILAMTAHDTPDAFTVEPTLRNHPPIDPFVLKWSWPLFLRDPSLDPEDLRQPRKSNSGQYAQKYSPDLISHELSILDGVKPSHLLRKLAEFNGISRAQFYKLAGQLRSQGSLLEKDGLWFKSPKPNHL